LDGQRPPGGFNGNPLKNNRKTAADAKMHTQSGSKKQKFYLSDRRVRELADEYLGSAVKEL
jgi:hypothetical protein